MSRLRTTNDCRIAIESGKFFFRIIKSGDASQIGTYIQQLGNETRNILNSVLEMVYFMRGGLAYTEAMNMSAGEREVVVDLVNKQIKSVKDNPQAVIAI